MTTDRNLSGPGLDGTFTPGTAGSVRQPARAALDDLFTVAGRYRSTEAYRDLLNFVARFRFYAPFNAMLLHIQMPGATYVAPPQRWLREYQRRIKPEAHPLVILQPKGPVMFVFDVTDTDPEKNAPPLPPEVERPFEVRSGRVGKEYSRTVENAKRDGISIVERHRGSQSAGEIRCAFNRAPLQVLVQTRPTPKYADVPRRYDLAVNSHQSLEAKYATLAHELAHLYCGHLGTRNEMWWPDRRGLSREVQEFEAESVSYLLCSRLGVESPSAEYLAGYVKSNEATPAVSLDCVMRAAGLIEQMGRQRLPMRKEKKL